MADPLNEIGVLKRREIEARIVGPIVEAFSEEFGESKTHEIVRRVIVEIAEQQGQMLAEQVGGQTTEDLAKATEPWKKGEALEIDVLEQTSENYSFNVTRCRYAEMYKSLGMAELGALLSCNRDFALCGGFNRKMKLTRTQTILGGASHCDFRYQLPGEDSEKES